MEESSMYSLISDRSANKPVWPAVIGVLSCVLGGRAILGSITSLVNLLSIPKGPTSILPGAAFECWNYVVAWSGLLSNTLLLVAGIVLLREWYRETVSFSHGRLLHQIYAFTSIALTVANQFPLYYSIWHLFLGETGLDGKTNPIESRQYFTVVFCMGMFTKLTELAYPVFLLIWFWKRKSPSIR